MHYFRVKSEIRIDQASRQSRHTERHFSVLREIIITDRFLNLNPLRERLSNDTSNCSGGTTKVQIDDDLRREATSNDNTGRKMEVLYQVCGNYNAREGTDSRRLIMLEWYGSI